MVYWLVLEKLGFLSVDRTKRLNQSKNHFMFAGNIVNLNNIDALKEISIKMFGSTRSLELLSEYLSTLLNTILGGVFLYFFLSCISYVIFFKIKKQKFLPKLQGKFLIAHDIKWSLINVFVESFLVSFLRMWLPRYSMAYYDIAEYGIFYLLIGFIMHVIFDESLTYWVHRWMHTFEYLYRKLHKIHHRSNDVTPFSGFAFHPFDAFAQALGTFCSCYFFPVHINIVSVMSIFTSMWAISIHDNVPLLPCKLFLYSTHHTIHHEVGLG